MLKICKKKRKRICLFLKKVESIDKDSKILNLQKYGMRQKFALSQMH